MNRNKYIHVKNTDKESKKIYPSEDLSEATSGSDGSILIKQFPNGVMLPLFTLQSSRFQKLPSSNLKRDWSTSGGDTGCFLWWGIACWGWMTSTHANFPAMPPIFELALPPSHQDMPFRHFPAPTSKAFQDRSKAHSVLPVLVTPSCWNWQFWNTAAVSTS